MFHGFSRVLEISVCSPLSLIKTIHRQTSQSLTREHRVRRLIPCLQRKNVRRMMASKQIENPCALQATPISQQTTPIKAASSVNMIRSPLHGYLKQDTQLDSSSLEPGPRYSIVLCLITMLQQV
jgi:hypothetical protein